jgi:hypothetical protein
MSFKTPNFVNRGSVRWIVLAVFLVGAVFGATGIAAAQLDGTETVYHNETVPITNDTTELQLTVNESNGKDLYVNYYRIADDSESTQTLESEDVELSVPYYERFNTTYPVETDNTAGYRVVVHSSYEDISAENVGNMTVTQLPLGSGVVDSGNESLDGGAVDSGNDSLGGGPVGFGGDSGNGTIIGIIAVVALALVVRMKA